MIKIQSMKNKKTNKTGKYSVYSEKLQDKQKNKTILKERKRSRNSKLLSFENNNQ